MKIDIRTDKVVYVTIGRWTYYIDDSTNEQIIKVFANRQIFHNHKSKQNDNRNNNNDKWNRV
jgi:hypothetical protein